MKEKIKYIGRSAFAMARGEANPLQVRDMWQALFRDEGAVIVYGPYDAVWPTIGVDGFTWFCESCGIGDQDLTDLLDAGMSGRRHGNLQHGDSDFQLIEVRLDPEEVR